MPFLWGPVWRGANGRNNNKQQRQQQRERRTATTTTGATAAATTIATTATTAEKHNNINTNDNNNSTNNSNRKLYSPINHQPAHADHISRKKKKLSPSALDPAPLRSRLPSRHTASLATNPRWRHQCHPLFRLRPPSPPCSERFHPSSTPCRCGRCFTGSL